MSLIGFDVRYKDLRDYILTITEEIWEQRGINLIHDYYDETTIVKTPNEEITGIQPVIKGTLDTLAAFPNRTLLGEDVISGIYGDASYYSSHRIRSTMTHLGRNHLGKATHHNIIVRTIADCVCYQNKIIEEWLVRDNAATALQIGVSPKKLGKQKALEWIAQDNCPTVMALEQRWQGPHSPVMHSEQAHMISHLYQDIWQNKVLGNINQFYDRAYLGYLPAGETAQNLSMLENWLFSYLSAFADGEFKLHHMIELNEPNQPIRFSLRWSYTATHCGYGRFGKPTNAPVVIMAISQIELRYGKIYQEWHLIDEINVWSQIYAHKEKNK